MQKSIIPVIYIYNFLARNAEVQNNLEALLLFAIIFSIFSTSVWHLEERHRYTQAWALTQFPPIGLAQSFVTSNVFVLFFTVFRKTMTSVPPVPVLLSSAGSDVCPASASACFRFRAGATM